jgi:hypothetical protein
MSVMTTEDYQLLMAETAAYAQEKVAHSQVSAAAYHETYMKLECEKAAVELESSKQLAQRSSINTSNHLRPSLILKPSLLCSDDGDGWEATYGELVAYGDTPEIAYQKFDELWTGRYEP